MLRTMEVTAKVKAAGVADGLEEGQFLALVSVFNNEDTYGDVVRPGAFAQTLMDWATKGDDVPVIWAHQWSDPFAHIGHVVKAAETLDGLEVLGQIDDLTGDDENPTAKQVYRLLKGRRVTQFSFAYDVPNGGGAWVKDDDHRWGGYYELRQLDLHEVGPCLLGVNRETELLAAKAQSLAVGAKAGRVLSQANYDRLSAAHESIGEVLAAATPEKARPEAAPTTTPEKSGQPDSAAASGIAPPAQPPETAPAQDASEETPSKTDTSSTEEETTPDPREAPSTTDDAAKAGADSARLRTDLELLELEVSLTE